MLLMIDPRMRKVVKETDIKGTAPAGNRRSRWTDFLASDGEKPDRNRDTEFVDPPATRAALMEAWEDGWNRVVEALEPLTDADLARTITIGSAHTEIPPSNAPARHRA